MYSKDFDTHPDTMKQIEKTEGQTELHPASLKAMPTSEAGVVHAAGVLSDGTITKQNRRKYEEATGRPNFELTWPATDGDAMIFW